MRCIMDTLALRRWGRVIHTLSLLGDEHVQFQFGGVGLAVTTFKADASICAKVLFRREFFTKFEEGDDGEACCAMLSKCILKPFRSLKFLTKCISDCELCYENGNDNLIIILHGKFGGEVQYSIALATGAMVYQQDIDLHQLRNLMNSDAKLFVSSLSNFSHGKGVKDLTIKATRDKVFLKNCMTNLVKKDGRVYTELCIKSNDFNEYDVKEECELTIDMKEFKIFVSFAEIMKLPLAIHFNTMNEPVVISARGDDNYYSTLTLGTRRLVTDTCRPFTDTANDSQLRSTQNVNSIPNTVHSRALPGTISSESTQRSSLGNFEQRNSMVQSMFPNLGNRFSPSHDYPGQDVIVVRGSDEEE